MHKLDLFKLVLKSDTYRKRAWVISAFSIIKENEDKWKENPYPYRIVQTPLVNYFYNPVTQDLEAIEGTTPLNPIFSFTDRIVLEPGDIPNVKETTETTIGNAYYNKACIADAFGDKVKYQSGLEIDKLQKEIAVRLRDTPLPGSPRESKYLYCDEYEKFANSVFYLTNFNQLCTWGLTEKVLSAPPGVKELRDKLMKQYKDQLHDPAILAVIMGELKKLDKEFLKGDPGMNFLLSKKSMDVVRSKLFLAYGAERSLSDGTKMNFVPKSLDEGWDIKHLPVMNNASRAGSYDRGAETQDGGVTFKELNRAFANLAITMDDCGSTIGIETEVQESTLRNIIGFSLITDSGVEFIEDASSARKYLGSIVRKRSPMYCTAGIDQLCKVCSGSNLSSNPTAVAMAVSDLGSVFMGLRMKSMHGKSISTAKLDWKKRIT
jgi:hypothetical protein